MSRINTDKIRKEALAKPGDGWPKNREWFRQRLLKLLDEIDRLQSIVDWEIEYNEYHPFEQKVKE